MQRRRDGTAYVTKKSVRAEDGPFDKEYLVTFTQAHPDVFANFKDFAKYNTKTLTNVELMDQNVNLNAIIYHLISVLRNVAPGPQEATRYHRIVVGILELVFYPELVSPEIEREINEGRKRIDLTFDNAAMEGFFYSLHTIHNTPCQYIMVECKNYSRDIQNPELDQMGGRFGINREGSE